MERELSIAAETAITLVALAAVLGIIMFTVVLGQGVKANSAAGITDVRDNMSQDYVKSLISGEIDNEMPAATAYNILTMYRGVIVDEASGYDMKVRNLSVDGSVLKDNLKGRVRLDIKETTLGTYVVEVNVLNNRGQVANSTTMGFRELRVKYTYR